MTVPHPAAQAKEFISQALAAVQDDPAAGSTLGELARRLASAQSNLYDASRLDAASFLSAAAMRRAMEFLAQSLQLLQDLRTESKAVGVAAASVARSLSVLYSATQKVPTPPPPPPPPPVAALSRPASFAAGSAPPPTADDQRRKTVHLQLDSVIAPDGDTQFYTGLSGSIEQGGIFIATFDIKPINSKIAVSFALPSGEIVQTRGLVRWIREYNPTTPDLAPGMGVRFTELREQDRRAIERYLEQRSPLLYDDE